MFNLFLRWIRVPKRRESIFEINNFWLSKKNPREGFSNWVIPIAHKIIRELNQKLWTRKSPKKARIKIKWNIKFRNKIIIWLKLYFKVVTGRLIIIIRPKWIKIIILVIKWVVVVGIIILELLAINIKLTLTATRSIKFAIWKSITSWEKRWIKKRDWHFEKKE